MYFIGLITMLSVILASRIGLLIGLLRVASYFSDTEILVHGSAAALVSPMFGLTLSLIFFEPAVCFLKNRGRESLTC